MRALVATVEANVEPVPGMHLLYLHSPALAQAARPGQFVLLRAGPGDDPYLRRPLAIHRLTEQGIALSFRASDPTLAALASRRVGEAVDLIGPCGRGFTLPPAQSAAALIARGAGIVPLLSILDRAPYAVQLVASVPTEASLYPRELLPRHVEYSPFIGRGQDAAFEQAMVEACRWGQRVYAGGPASFHPLLRRAVEKARLGLREGIAEVWVEGELGCGVGACRGCLIETRHGYRRVCTDGPVFDLASLLP